VICRHNKFVGEGFNFVDFLSIGPAIKLTPADKIRFGSVNPWLSLSIAKLSSLFAHRSSYIRPLSLMDFLMTENGLGFGTCWYNNYSISKKTG